MGPYSIPAVDRIAKMSKQDTFMTDNLFSAQSLPKFISLWVSPCVQIKPLKKLVS